jgi:methionine synthase II (cobalamin-independent)
LAAAVPASPWVTPAIAETVRKQVEAGIDCIGDGEFWTARSLAHYTAHFTGIVVGFFWACSPALPHRGQQIARFLIRNGQ